MFETGLDRYRYWGGSKVSPSTQGGMYYRQHQGRDKKSNWDYDAFAVCTEGHYTPLVTQAWGDHFPWYNYFTWKGMNSVPLFLTTSLCFDSGSANPWSTPLPTFLAHFYRAK
jgi:hypothetical protein